MASASIDLHKAVPILRIFSVDKAKEFYLGFLGFSIDWEQRFGEDLPLYMQVSRGGVALHLSEHHGDACPGAAVMIHMKGIADLHRELAELNYRYAKPGLENAPWNARTVTVTDPFGNRLVFNEPKDAS